MVNTVIIILYALVVLIAVLLTCLILIQPSKSGGGLGASFGGVGESVFGAHASSHLTKLTVIMITVFFVVVLALAVISGHANKVPKSILQLESAMTAPVKKEKAAPSAMEVTPSGEKIPVPVPKKEEVSTAVVPPVQTSAPVSVPEPAKK